MTAEVLASPDTPRNIRYAIFGATIDDAIAYDIYLIRSDDPLTWLFINSRPTLDLARQCVRAYLTMRARAIETGYRP